MQGINLLARLFVIARFAVLQVFDASARIRGDDDLCQVILRLDQVELSLVQIVKIRDICIE